MKQRLFGTSIVAGLCAVVILGLPSFAGAYSNDFESDTAGWFDNGGTITRQPSGYNGPTSVLPYADDIASAGGDFHARLGRGPCEIQGGGGGDTAYCSGPYTDWGGYGDTWNGPYTTQVDIYLDAAYANTSPANDDSYGGNIACLTASDGPTNTDCKGTRFDYTSAINKAGGGHLRDFGFNVATGLNGDSCTGFTVTGGMNVNRNGASPYNPAFDPECIPDSGWYTFKHSFYENGAGNLEVRMEIIPVGGQANSDWTWTFESADADGPDAIETVGCNRYGWFSNQEIFGLPIDNAKMEGGCATPIVTDGQISPTQTTCQQYRDGTAPVLGEVQYTTRGTKINSVSPGVFFYYGKVSGTEGQTVEITQSNDGTTAPPIPIQNGQVVLYNATTCKVVRWQVTTGDVGEATGTLPSSGDFIVGVKYSPSALKGQAVPVPPTVTYSFGTTDAATIDLTPKH